MSLVSEVKTLLTSISNVYIGSLPATPDNVVGIYQTGGFPKGLTESELGQPTFQIRVRNTSYSACSQLCNDIDGILHGYTGVKALLIQNMSGALDIGRDANNRQEMTMNYKTYYLK